MPERIHQPLFEQYDQAYREGGEHLTLFINQQRRRKFDAKISLERKVPMVAAMIERGHFPNLENPNQPLDAQQLVRERHKLLFDAVVANGAAHLHAYQALPDIAGDYLYQGNRDTKLAEAYRNRFIRPFTEQQQMAYFQVKRAAQEKRETSTVSNNEAPIGTTNTPTSPVRTEVKTTEPAEQTAALSDAHVAAKEPEKIKADVPITTTHGKEKDTTSDKPSILEEIQSFRDGLTSEQSQLLDVLTSGSRSYIPRRQIAELTGIPENAVVREMTRLAEVLSSRMNRQIIVDLKRGQKGGISLKETIAAAEEHESETSESPDKIDEDSSKPKKEELTLDEAPSNEQDSILQEAARSATLVASSQFRVNGRLVQLTDQEFRLLRAVTNGHSYHSTGYLKLRTGLGPAAVKTALTKLSTKLSEQLGLDISLESRRGNSGGVRLSERLSIEELKPDAILLTPKAEVKVEEEIETPQENKLVDFADRQISAMLGAIEYRIITQNKDSLIESLGQAEYDALAESCRQLSLLVRASTPTTVEFAAAARRQNITLDQYQEIRNQLLNSISGLRNAEDREELLTNLSPDHQRVTLWLINRPDAEFSQLIEEVRSLDETQLKSEQALYANSWSTDNTSSPENKALRQSTEVISPTRMKNLQPAIVAAIKTAQEKVREGQQLTPDNLNRIFKPLGKATGYINKATIDFATKNGIIAQEGAITPEDVIVLVFIYEITEGKTFRRGFKKDITSLRSACNEIREEIRRQQTSNQETA